MMQTGPATGASQTRFAPQRIISFWTDEAPMTATRLPVLSLLETRVLGVLCEKQHTVPDTYPLSLNALVAGCNQKTSRHPIIEAGESEVLSAIDSLKGPALVIETSGGRVTRYAHNMERGPRSPSPCPPR